MSIQNLLDQLLNSAAGATGADRADMGKYATGAAVGGVLGLLLGSGSGRRMGGKALKYGSVAALGAMAWKAYQQHLAQQQAAAGTAPQPAAAPTPLAALPAPQQEQHSRALLMAMIAAAKADGHMDARERDLVQAELNRVAADAQTRQWVQYELERPVDPAEVAAAASGPEMAAEIYLASLLVVDETTTMERAYLDELARQLRLAPALKADLEARAVAA